MTSKPSSHRLKVSEGDWICKNKECENLNFARRDKCNKCGQPMDDSDQVVKNSGHEIGERFAEKSKGLFSANDWQCNKCGNINWARRSTCNVCNAPKVGPDEIRTGYGGGFKENDNITYKEKEDSDGEFDEYGRKKKKYRGTTATTVKQDLVKDGGYNDDGYNDEEEEDDDDDVDLSKYALSSDEDGPPPEPKILKRRSSKSPSRSPKRRRSRSSSSSSRSSRSSRSRSRSRSPHHRKR